MYNLINLKGECEQMASQLKEMAKLALKRLSSGFWQNEQDRRKKTLAILENNGADTTAAKKFLVDETKHQIAAVTNPEDEALYATVKKIYLSGNAENALSVLIDQEQIRTMDENARQRYIFNLSAKLQEFRTRFEKEQQFDCQSISL